MSSKNHRGMMKNCFNLLFNSFREKAIHIHIYRMQTSGRVTLINAYGYC